MKKKAIALIPFVAGRLARRRRKAKTARGAKIGGPALLAGAVVLALVLRKRRRAGTGHDVSQEELKRSEPARTETGTAHTGSQAVTPDTGANDPLVREQTGAAAAEARSIGNREASR